MNFYGPGDHFIHHNDQSEMGLVGIMLLGLHDSTQSEKDELSTSMVIHEKCSTIQCHHKHIAMECYGVLGHWCAFYSDVDYEVLPISDGHLITITFKVYSSITLTNNNNNKSSNCSNISNSINTLPLPSLPLLSSNTSSVVNEDGNSGQITKHATRGKRNNKVTDGWSFQSSLSNVEVKEEEKKSASELRKRQMTSLISSNIITTTYEFAELSRPLSSIRDMTSAVAARDGINDIISMKQMTDNLEEAKLEYHSHVVEVKQARIVRRTTYAMAKKLHKIKAMRKAKTTTTTKDGESKPINCPSLCSLLTITKFMNDIIDLKPKRVWSMKTKQFIEVPLELMKHLKSLKRTKRFVMLLRSLVTTTLNVR
jgi:hypothetical protein